MNQHPSFVWQMNYFVVVAGQNAETPRVLSLDMISDTFSPFIRQSHRHTFVEEKDVSRKYIFKDTDQDFRFKTVFVSDQENNWFRYGISPTRMVDDPYLSTTNWRGETVSMKVFTEWLVISKIKVSFLLCRVNFDYGFSLDLPWKFFIE